VNVVTKWLHSATYEAIRSMRSQFTVCCRYVGVIVFVINSFYIAICCWFFVVVLLLIQLFACVVNVNCYQGRPALNGDPEEANYTHFPSVKNKSSFSKLRRNKL
jgi:hypothetical protein